MRIVFEWHVCIHVRYSCSCIVNRVVIITNIGGFSPVNGRLLLWVNHKKEYSCIYILLIGFFFQDQL